MANCYGTKKYEKIKQEQLALGKDGEWKLEDERTERYGDYELQYTTYASSLKTYDHFVYDHGKLSVYNGGKLIYSCNDMYEENQPTFFYFYTLNDCNYLIFRKDGLYGYSILNLTTLEEHNYFPDVVLNREKESFIIVEARLWKYILLLFGCYWGGPYVCHLLNTQTYQTHLLNCRDIDESKTVIDENKLTVYFADGDKPEMQTCTYEELAHLLSNSLTYDI